MNYFSLFLLELQKRVEKMQIRKAYIEAVHLARRKQQVIHALAKNVPFRKMQKAKKKAAKD
jgi:hypothetical protein